MVVPLTQAMDTLLKMFPNIDESVIKSSLEEQRYHMERTVERLLQFNQNLYDSTTTPTDNEKTLTPEEEDQNLKKIHTHPLSIQDKNNPWICDGCGLKFPPGSRYKCALDCDYDICTTCYVTAKKGQKLVKVSSSHSYGQSNSNIRIPFNITDPLPADFLRPPYYFSKQVKSYNEQQLAQDRILSQLLQDREFIGYMRRNPDFLESGQRTIHDESKWKKKFSSLGDAAKKRLKSITEKISRTKSLNPFHTESAEYTPLQEDNNSVEMDEFGTTNNKDFAIDDDNDNDDDNERTGYTRGGPSS